MLKGLEVNLIVPDLWQQEAVRALQNGRDVVVQAPTGSGKTYIFELLYPSLNGQAIFTVPTRALANDKLAEWRTRGWDVGIATGDLALNTGAKVVVATLETQRARFLRSEGPQLFVVDEYQMIADPVRGVHYELTIALAPKHTQLLLLSGSVANPHDVVAWLQRIGRDPLLVRHDERPVPLEQVDLTSLSDSQFVQTRNFWPRMVGRALRADLGPALVFAPKRNAAEEMAQQIASAISIRDPLTLSPQQEALAGKRLAKLLRSRVAFHHSGLSYAARAGVIEPLAKAGQLNVVVATMGLAAGINFSMRSVLVTGTRYMAGTFQRHVQPDELLQMFGRAGRRGLDQTGYVLSLPDVPRLGDARPRQLKRATQVDWPSLIGVMRAAAERGEQPFAAAVELSRSLFSTQNVALGVEHSLGTGARPCGLWVDDERARFVRRPITEMLNSHGKWEPLSEPADFPLGEILVRENDRWIPALRLPRMLDGLGFGNLCKLAERYGREIPLAIKMTDENVAPVKWLRKIVQQKAMTREEFDRVVLPRIAELTRGGELADVIERGEMISARIDFSTVQAQAHRDSLGRAVQEPPTREALPLPCRDCDQRERDLTITIASSPAHAWRTLGLVEKDGTPTRRGVVFSFFQAGEGLAIAAALEDETYEIGDLVFDLANLRAGPRFAAEDAVLGGRLGILCQRVYGRADHPGYIEMGVPSHYGSGASEIIRELIASPNSRYKLTSESLHHGDIERALMEWRSLLRHIVGAPDLEWNRWMELKAEAARYIDRSMSPALIDLPPLLAAQQRRAFAFAR